ncbi:protein kinase family protein [Paenibacillus donghaensis]|uniref:protein kinase family protein n=1 Tax=Paenibacillus donghaensis TaxID=414771 RepID=UPI0018838EAC|nr:protein kinase family protein [Paenibacillus donghaensis]MBE9915615.1 protein kinase family protein [Paenibacillus donghaensis]
MESSPTENYVSYETRLARYANVSTALSLLSNEQLHDKLEEAMVLGAGIGGTTALMHLDDTPIFVKIIPLSKIEKRTENFMSTKNIFELPPYCHYGIGAPSGGIWREVASHTMTTNWVLAKQCESFPLMYHWRVLNGLKRPISAELSDVSQMVEFWGSKDVRTRIESLENSEDSVVLFCEYVPYNLHDWLTKQVDIGEETATAAIAMVDSELRSSVWFMNANGLLHFDAHFRNILTDGHRLYITDFGLATSSRFDLTDYEIEFLALNKTHDGCYVVTELVNWLVTSFGSKKDRSERLDFIRSCAAGTTSSDVMDSAAQMIKKYAPIAVVMNDFYTKLVLESRATPFPFEEIKQISAVNGFEPIKS